MYVCRYSGLLNRTMMKNYFELNLRGIPHHYMAYEASRMTLAFFVLSGLDIIGGLDVELRNSPNVTGIDNLKEGTRKLGWIDWIYGMQITDGDIGFRGGSFMGADYSPQSSIQVSKYDMPHLAMTYTALLSLLVLGDSLDRVDRKGIISTLQACQQDDGSFSPLRDSLERDMRFIYCACAISYILNDWSGIDLEKTLEFIRKSQSFDGAFGVAIDNESHGGSTYCVVASLSLMGRLDAIETDQLISWLLCRQVKGFNGRVNKPEDTCYSYWILGASKYADVNAMKDFLKTTETKHGGYGKGPGDYPDIMHSYMGLAGLAIVESPDLAPFHCALGVTRRAHDYGVSLGLCSGPIL